jgi:tetratricopeptide (TPR) repeat protein
MKDALDRAKSLRSAARECVASQDLKKAVGLLDEAITTLRSALESDGPSAALYAALAECLGMRGGILRRLGELDDAVASYGEGRRFEQDEEFGKDDSYNLVNALVIPLLKAPRLLDADGVRNELARAIRLLRRQVRGSRNSDYWAQADLARCLLLAGEYDDAIRALDRFVQLGGLKDAFVTSIQMLRELEESFSAEGRREAPLLTQAIAYLRQASTQGSAVERPTCFVLMPFGRKQDPSGRTIDFDEVYRRIIEPAILEAGLSAIRADAEESGPIIHKAMFERLLLSEMAVADLTLNNPNVFYELGIRHGSRARVTVLMSAETSAPFDVNLLRALRYRIEQDGRIADDTFARVRAALKVELDNAKRRLLDTTLTDNPISALLQDFKAFDKPSRFKTDVFRDMSEYSNELKKSLADARAKESVADLRRIEEHVRMDESEPGVLIDLMLSYRALRDWDDMLTLIARMPKLVRDTEMVREQQALALNRRNKAGDQAQALLIIEQLIAERGPSSEAYSIMGRVYKDQWIAAQAEEVRARGLLRRAIDAYRRGFIADVRDTYPGINLLTLLEIDGSRAALAEKERVLPVVRYVAEQRDKAKLDYWDYATLLELAVLAKDEEDIPSRLPDAIAAKRENFEPETTARNLRCIKEARNKRGEAASHSLDLAIAELDKAAAASKPEKSD